MARIRPTLAVVAALLVLATAFVAGGPDIALWALATLAAAVGTVRLRAVHPDDDATLWRWSTRGGWAVTVGLGVESVVRAVGTGSAAQNWALSCAAIAACAAVYQGLVRWNRSSTALSDPGDWANGVSAFLAAVALGCLIRTQLSPGPSTLGPDLLGHVLRLAAATVLVGSCLTVTAIADLRSDRRAALLSGGALTALIAELIAMLAGLDVVAGLGWAALIVAAAIACGLPHADRTATYSSSRATTAGSVVVIAAALAIVATNAVLPGGSRVVVAIAVAAGLIACVRALRLVRDLALLASSRVEARTDSLTGVPNRRALVERLDAVSDSDGTALLVIDLDRFKDVNDRYGHAVGDALIQDMAERLETVLAGRGLLARLGGDEFAVVLDDPDPERAAGIAHELCAAATMPSEIGGRLLRVSASIGVASTLLGEHRDGELLRGADAAMYIAKRAGSGVQVYDEATDARARTQHELAEDLRGLLTGTGTEHGELTVHFQPQLDAHTGAVVAAEALVRWDHPQRGLLGPFAFLDLAEEHGLMTPLTWHVLDQATRQALAWRTAGVDIPVAVNLSTSCLEFPGLLGALSAALTRTGLPPSSLVVEITETTLMHDPELAIEVTRKIRDLGIAVSIDDYGTGYSSLAYLNDLPAEELKLDRTFTGKLTTDPRTRAIVSGTIDLAHHLGLRLVAEGVEDTETLDQLRLLGCDRTQGYLHARPMPADDFRAWLSEAATVVDHSGAH